MSFYGLEFIYNGIPSSNFGLFISKIDGQGVLESPLGSSVKLITKKIFRNPVEFLYGVEQGPVLEFDLEFFSINPLSALDRSLVASWLFGQQKRGKLQILQDDLQNVYFNCIMDSSTASYAGNLAIGFKAHVICDSPFGWEEPNVLSYTNQTEGAIEQPNVILLNQSADNFYTYPRVVFEINKNSGNFVIYNNTDDALTGIDRPFQFTLLSKNEIITVDNRKQMVISSTSNLRVNSTNFNLMFLRLLPGINNLSIYGDVEYYSIEYDIAKKVGG